MTRFKQTPEDCHSRLVMMHADKGDTWDLSPNDKDAIAWVLTELDKLRNVNSKLRGACIRIAALCEFPEAEARDALAGTPCRA